MFLAGKIDEAIKLLDDERLRISVAEARKRKEEAEKTIEDAVQAWLLKAQLLTVQFRFDEAEAAYREAIHAAPDSFKANFALALFGQQLNRVENARTAYERCLEMARKTNRDDNDPG